MDTIFNIIAGAIRLAVDIPMLGIGIVIGMLFCYYLIRKNPTLLAKIISAASSDLQKLIAKQNSTAAQANALQAAAAAVAPVVATVAPVVAAPVATQAAPSVQAAPVAPAAVASASPAPAPTATPAAPAAQ